MKSAHAAAAALALLATAVGCNAREPAAPDPPAPSMATVPTPTIPAPSSSLDVVDRAPAPAHRTHDAFVPSGDRPDHDLPLPNSPTAEQLQLDRAQDPVGRDTDIALRFMQAVQTGDDWQAAAQLKLAARAFFATAHPAALTRVMNEVRKESGATADGRCLASERLDYRFVTVTCGEHRVVVRVDDGIVGRGVVLDDAEVLIHRVDTAHGHALTTYELL